MFECVLKIFMHGYVRVGGSVVFIFNLMYLKDFLRKLKKSGAGGGIV